MRAPKGFAKNYFSLAAMCAYSAQMTLDAQSSSARFIRLSFEEESIDKAVESDLCLDQALAKEPDSKDYHSSLALTHPSFSHLFLSENTSKDIYAY